MCWEAPLDGCIEEPTHRQAQKGALTPVSKCAGIIP
jgi:hypothetical protein